MPKRLLLLLLLLTIDLDSTAQIVEQIAASTESGEVNCFNNGEEEENPSCKPFVTDLREPFLENLCELYDTQPEMMNFIFFKNVDHVEGYETVGKTTEAEQLNILNKANVTLHAVAHERDVLHQKLTRKNHECDLLSKQIFDKSQQVKILNDRVKNLEDENKYRLEVVRLEGLLEEKLETIRQMKESNESNDKDNNDKITWLELLIEEREKDIDNWKEDHGNAKAEVRRLEEVLECERKEIKRLEKKVECEKGIKAEVSRLEELNAKKEGEVTRLLETIMNNEKEMKTLEAESRAL